MTIMPRARGARSNESQLGGGKSTVPREGVVVQQASPEIPHFFCHGGENAEAGLRWSEGQR
jgi:hypothetical protein